MIDPVSAYTLSWAASMPIGMDHETYHAHFSPFLYPIAETTIPKTVRPTPETPSSTRVEPRKLANFGLEDTSWLQVKPVTACIGVCAPRTHARQRSCRLGKKSRADRTSVSVQKRKG